MMKSKNYHKTIENIVQEITDNTYRFNNPSVEDGTMGLAVLYFYCHKYYKDDFFLNKAEEMIEVSISFLSSISDDSTFTPKYKGDSLSSLISSFGKGLLFVENKLGYKYEFTEYYEAIDEILIELTSKSLEEKDFDFFSGALSAGHYFINKFNVYKDDVSKQILLKIYSVLVKEAISHDIDQIYWKAPVYADQVYLGISHGSAMIINFFIKLFNIGIFNDDDLAPKLIINSAVNFVMARKREIEDGFFPHVFDDGPQPKTTIYAMCYGDLGILYVLKLSLDVYKSQHSDEIEKMLLKCSERQKDINQTSDASIFYGASGIYCIYKALFLNFKNSNYKQVYQYWNAQIETYQNPEETVCAGFKFLFDKKSDENSLQYSFGWGLAGLGICMLLDVDEELPLLNELLLIGL